MTIYFSFGETESSPLYYFCDHAIHVHIWYLVETIMGKSDSEGMQMKFHSTSNKHTNYFLKKVAPEHMQQQFEVMVK